MQYCFPFRPTVFPIYQLQKKHLSDEVFPRENNLETDWGNS